MYRYFYDELEKWEKEGAPKPLLVIGARQVGKTHVIDQFCKEKYDDYVRINLESQPEYLSIFEETLVPEKLLRNIGMLLGRRLDEHTTIFIDEIQQSERAITSLKYFCETDKPYRIIGAGSLLGVKIKRFGSSFPVGKVFLKYLYPMSFFEFLCACGEELMLEGITDAYKRKKAMPQGLHEKACALYHDYLYVGGMPEAVASYVAGGCNPMAVNADFYSSLKTMYLADMTKYTISAAEGVKITEVFASVPRQLSRENPKFKYKEIRPYASKRDFSSSVDWLVASGLLYPVKKVEAVRIPLSVYAAESGDRFYLSDTGLLSHITGLPMSVLFAGADNIYKGAVTENYCMQEFAAYGKNLYFFKPSEGLEIDLLMETDGEIIPIEIKSGRHKRSTSLKNYREKYNPPYAVRFSELNFGFADGLYSIPLYALECMARE